MAKTNFAPSFSPMIYQPDEHKLRQLANEMAKDIIEPIDVLKSLGVTPDQFEDIKDTRAYRQMYAEALAEWQGANNTQKRVKLKAAATVEVVIHEFYRDLRNNTETLSARTELLKTLARIGGLGNPEPIQQKNMGQFFKLEIHIDGKQSPIIIGGEAIALTETSLAASEPYDDF